MIDPYESMLWGCGAALVVTMLSAMVAVSIRPSLWRRSAGTIFTALALVLFLPIRTATYERCSFDDNTGGLQILAEALVFWVVVGFLHVVFFLGVLAAIFDSPLPSKPARYPRETLPEASVEDNDLGRLLRYSDPR